MKNIVFTHSFTPPEGTAKWPFDPLFNAFIPMLSSGGFTEDEVNQITIKNPATAFTVKNG